MYCMTDSSTYNTKIERYRLHMAGHIYVLLITSFAFICRLSYASIRPSWPDRAEDTLTGSCDGAGGGGGNPAGAAWCVVVVFAPVFAVDAAGLSTGLGGGGGGLPAYVGGGGLLAYVGGGGWVA
jgi:hypothetical protein